MLLISTEATIARPPKIFWLLLVLGMILAADSATAFVFGVAPRQEMSGVIWFYIAAPLATLLVGLPAWVRFMVLPGKVTPGRGAWLGTLCSLIAHPVMWTLFFVAGLFLPGSNMTGANILPIIIVYSLLLGGWITTPIGAASGALLAWLQIGLTNSKQQRVNRQRLASQQREMSEFNSTQEKPDTSKNPDL